MELVERYLQAVKPLLPRDQREDILAELSEHITSRMEDRQAELGRELSEAEVESILSQLGHPLIVAGRYRPSLGSFTFGRKQVIGPELFPFYQKALLIVGGVTTAAITAVTIAMYFWKGVTFGESMHGLFFHLGIQFLIQTVIWSALDAYVTKHPDSWRSERAPKQTTKPGVSRLESVMQVVVLLAMWPWIQVFLGIDRYKLGEGVALNPIWHQIYVPLLILTVAGIAQAAANLIRPDWTQLRLAARILLTLAWVVVLGFVIANGNWLILDGTVAGNVATASQKLEWVNHNIILPSLLVTAIASAIQVVYYLVTWFRGRRRGLGVANAV